MSYSRTITLAMPFDEAVPKVKEAFASQGFGTLTEIDVQATLAAKIKVEVEPYVILGACNPDLAYQALQIEPEIGVLLPCNVVVRQRNGQTVVHALDPQVLAQVPDRADELGGIASEASRRIDAALAEISS